MTKNIFDAATVLRALSEAAETASAAEAGVAVVGLYETHYLNRADNQDEYAATAVIHNIAIGGDVAPTAVSFYLEVAADAAFGSGAVRVASIPYVSGNTTLEMLVDYATIRKLHPTATAMRVGCVITGGTNPTVDYGCFLTKH